MLVASPMQADAARAECSRPKPDRICQAQPGPRRAGKAGPAPARVRRAGFTLLEVLLALTLVALLVGAGVIALASLRTGRQLEEGAWRFETMLRMARADAARHGRRLRLRFDGEGGAWQVLWESDPIARPGLFDDYASCVWRDSVPEGLVRVVRCELQGPSAYQTLVLQGAREPAAGAAALDAVTFYPDGSCDAAEIELADRDGKDVRTAVIAIDGLTGTVTRQILTPTEMDERGGA
jgi:prepilin-type N-terminal cleavage/methylation domain-containing protein